MTREVSCRTDRPPAATAPRSAGRAEGRALHQLADVVAPEPGRQPLVQHRGLGPLRHRAHGLDHDALDPAHDPARQGQGAHQIGVAVEPQRPTREQPVHDLVDVLGERLESVSCRVVHTPILVRATDIPAPKTTRSGYKSGPVETRFGGCWGGEDAVARPSESATRRRRHDRRGRNVWGRVRLAETRYERSESKCRSTARVAEVGALDPQTSRSSASIASAAVRKGGQVRVPHPVDRVARRARRDVERRDDAPVASHAAAPRSSAAPARARRPRATSPAHAPARARRASAARSVSVRSVRWEQSGCRERGIRCGLRQPGQQHAAHAGRERGEARADRDAHAHDPARGNARDVDDVGAVEHRRRDALVDVARQRARGAAARSRAATATDR